MNNNKAIMLSVSDITKSDDVILSIAQINTVIGKTPTIADLTADIDEIWKDIPDYEGLYQVSNLGRLRSLDRVVYSKTNIPRRLKGRIISPRIDRHGYDRFMLCKDSISTSIKAHKLICICFLNYSPKEGYCIDHINGNKADNRLSNLQLITYRENITKSIKIGKSKYRGVDFNIQRGKWRSRVMINSKRINLGYFENEYEAHLAYENKLKSIL